ncbi:MAG: hypothetical protein R2762_10965 [Bryobacteraceae bacterium]
MVPDPMSLPAPEHHSFRVPLHCRYLLQAPAEGTASILAVATHGYGMNAAAMLQLTHRLLGADVLLASVEAPNQFYLKMQSPTESETGYNWGTRPHWQSAVSLHHEMLRTVLADCRGRFRIAPSRCLLVGFSQPVGLNYRFAATHPDEVSGVIGICGGIPRDWEQDARYGRVRASILHIARDEDEYYPASQTSLFAERLRNRAADVEFHMLPGAHRFPSQASKVVQPWMERVFAAPGDQGSSQRAPSSSRTAT